MASPFRFFYPIRVRWSEVDPYQVVFNGHYLNYFDVAITEYFRNLGLRFTDPDAIGGAFYVRKATLEYLSPARFDDDLDVGVRIGRIGTSSIQFLLTINRAEQVLVTGEIVYVNTDPATRQPAPVSVTVREAVTRFEPF